MATNRWLGTATAVAQVYTSTPGGTIAAENIFTLTITGWDGTTKAISVTGYTSAANVAAAMVVAWNASTHALCTPITASGTVTVILTADTAGVAFSVAASVVQNGGATLGTFTGVATTASAGPKHWDTITNWSTGAVPTGAQDVYIENFTGDILYGLNQSAIDVLTSLNIGQSFTGAIGVNGATGCLGTYLQIKTTALNIGQHNGSGTPAGSGRIMIDLGATLSTVMINNSGSPLDSYKPTIRLKAAVNTTTINVKKGNVGLAYESGETSTVGTINISYVSQISSDVDFNIGAGVTLTTLTQIGGDVILSCAATTVTASAGTLRTDGAGAITTLNVKGGTTQSDSTGTITALNIYGGLVDFSKSAAARTVTTLKMDSPGKLKYDPAILTLTNKVQPISTAGIIVYTASAA